MFTTIPLGVDVPVPVHEISLFFDEDDIGGIRNILRLDTATDISGYFDERLFFAHLTLSDREEVLDFLCERVVAIERVSPTLRASVDVRERLAPTAFGNMVALPHPMVSMGRRTVVCLGILDHFIKWDDGDVRVVFMLILAKNSQEEPTGLLEALSSLFMDERAIRRLVDQQQFGVLMSLLRER